MENERREGERIGELTGKGKRGIELQFQDSLETSSFLYRESTSFYGGARFLEALVTFLIKKLYRENGIEKVCVCKYVYTHIYIFSTRYRYLFSFVE